LALSADQGAVYLTNRHRWQDGGVSSEQPTVIAVHLDAKHRFSKTPTEQITLIAGHGVEGDAHAGATVKHRSRRRWNPSLPNLRQVHLMHAELFAELTKQGFDVQPGQLGENVTTRGVDLLTLPTGTLLHLGPEAVVEVTGLRNPCVQIDRFQPGLLKQVLNKDDQGQLTRKAGIMSVVLHGGPVAPGDAITIQLPAEPHHILAPV
jgi:MOSC domain-containing protein YiiM